METWIDWHSHHTAPEVVETFAEFTGKRPKIDDYDSTDFTKRVKEMDEVGIDLQLVCQGAGLYADQLPAAQALRDLMDYEQVKRLTDQDVIEMIPLAYMRGRTLNDAFIILDEAQNTTSEQMKMFLTRLGFNSKMVITGDITQVDLPSSRASGLIEIQAVLKRVTGIRFVYFTEKDVVRHELVSEIVRAYDEWGRAAGGERA